MDHVLMFSSMVGHVLILISLYCPGIFHCMDITHLTSPFIHWWTCGFFHFLATVNNAAMNIYVQVLNGHVSFLLGHYLGVELLGYMVTNSAGSTELFPARLHPFPSPAAVCDGFAFPVSLLPLVAVHLFRCKHFSGCEVASLCGFGYFYPDGQWSWSFFHVLLTPHFSNEQNINIYCFSVHTGWDESRLQLFTWKIMQ